MLFFDYITRSARKFRLPKIINVRDVHNRNTRRDQIHIRNSMERLHPELTFFMITVTSTLNKQSTVSLDSAAAFSPLVSSMGHGSFICDFITLVQFSMKCLKQIASNFVGSFYIGSIYLHGESVILLKYFPYNLQVSLRL